MTYSSIHGIILLLKKLNKRDLIKKLVVEPKTQKRPFWAREMKLLNDLLEMFPDNDFWIKMKPESYPSLAVVRSEQGIKSLRKKFREFKYKIPQKKEIKLGEKVGKDRIYNKTPKTIKDFIDG